MSLSDRTRRLEQRAARAGRFRGMETEFRVAGPRAAVDERMLRALFSTLERRFPGLPAAIVRVAESGLPIPAKLGIVRSIIGMVRAVQSRTPDLPAAIAARCVDSL